MPDCFKNSRKKKINDISGNEAFAILDQILEEVSFTPEDLDEHIRQFSFTIPLDPSSFFPPRESAPQQVKHFSAEPRPRQERKVLVDEPVKFKEQVPFKPTLNDRAQSPQRPAIISNFQKISRIKDHLTINQKFMFTKVLFHGDFESFSKAVDDLDHLPDMDSAMQYLEKQSSDWDRESREFHEFMEMVEKRFV